MSPQDIVKDEHFEEVAEVKTDEKKRVALGKAGLPKARIYKVYRNALGQLILDPQVTIPAYEQWLFKNKKAAKMVQEGLEDAREGRLAKADEDYTRYIDDPE